MNGHQSRANRIPRCIAFCILGLTWMLGSVAAAQNTPQKNTPSRPPFAKVEAAVRKSFDAQRDREPNDLITQSEVALALQQVEKTGWRLEEPELLLERVLPDSDYLVQQLRTRHGRRFMKQVGGRPLMYDQLDRVARVPGGQALVRDLPKLPDAAVQATQLEQFLPKIGSGRARRVKDFNKPTGRIYTVDQLIGTLRKIYDDVSLAGI